MQDFHDWYYPFNPPHMNGLDPSHYFYALHYPQSYPMIPPSKLPSSTETRPYNREQQQQQQQQPDASQRPLMSSTIPIMDDSPASNDAFSSGDREMDAWMYWESSSPLYNPSPSQSSDTTSSPSPPSPLPNMPPQPPLIIHQPRPYRRIPIVSLSQLASACDELDNRPPQQNTLSPLPFEYLDFNFDPLTHPPFPPSAAAFNAYRSPMTMAKTSDRTILCPCGCMGHYICT